MGIISWIVLGAIAGFLANLVVGGREGLIGTIILGIIGAVVGGYLAQAVLHKGDVTGVNIESIVIAVVGAIIVLFVWRALRGAAGAPDPSVVVRKERTNPPDSRHRLSNGPRLAPLSGEGADAHRRSSMAPRRTLTDGSRADRRGVGAGPAALPRRHREARVAVGGEAPRLSNSRGRSGVVVRQPRGCIWPHSVWLRRRGR